MTLLRQHSPIAWACRTEPTSEAIRWLEQAAEIFPDEPDSHVCLGGAYLAFGDRENARGLRITKPSDDYSKRHHRRGQATARTAFAVPASRGRASHPPQSPLIKGGKAGEWHVQTKHGHEE